MLFRSQGEPAGCGRRREGGACGIRVSGTGLIQDVAAGRRQATGARGLCPHRSELAAWHGGALAIRLLTPDRQDPSGAAAGLSAGGVMQGTTCPGPPPAWEEKAFKKPMVGLEPTTY